MASENTIIIDVEVQASEAAEKLAQTKNEIAELKKQQKDLNATIKENGMVTAAQAQQMANLQGQLKSLTQEEKMYTAQLNTATDGNKEYGKSLTALSAELAKMKAEYRNMSKEMRESAQGQDLQKRIQELDKVMKDSDASLGDFGRNVGNYQSALLGLGDNATKVANLFAGGFKQGIMAAGNAVKAFTKTMLLNPVIAAVLVAFKAFMVVLDKIKEGFSRNDEAGTRLQAALERFRPIVDAVSRVFVGLANVISKVVEWASKGASVLLGWIPGFKKASEAAAEHVNELDALEQAERDYAEHSAERQNERAKLEDEARNNTELTTQQRIEKMQQALELERQDMEERRDIAKRKWEAAKEEAERIGDSSDATAKRISDLRVAYINSETEFFNGTRRIQKSIKSFQNELESDAKAEQARRKAAWQKAQADRKQAAQTELAELRKLEDMTIAMITDEAEREEKTANAKYTREIADLKKRLDEEKNLTAKAREAINAQIVLLEKQHTAEVEAIREKYSKEALDREIAAQREIIDARIAAMDEGQAKEEAAVNAKYAAELQDLRRRLTEEADLTVSEREALNERIKAIEVQQAREIEAIRSEAIKKTYDALALDLSNRLSRAMLDAGENARMQAEAQLRFAEQSHAALLAMDEQTKTAMYDNEAQYQAAVLASEKAVYDARKANEETLQQQANEIGQTMQAVTSSLSDLFGAAAEDTEAYEKFKKAMAIVDAMISMATTIAAATTASTQGDPYTMAIRIAANVAAVTAQFAAVIKAIKAASIPSAPSFSEGGVVPGDSYTGDKVTARVNSGEMILTRAMQENLLRLLANGIPAATIDYARLEEAFRDAMSEMPNPVMIYSEFEQFQRNVKKIRNITKI